MIENTWRPLIGWSVLSLVTTRRRLRSSVRVHSRSGSELLCSTRHSVRHCCTRVMLIPSFASSEACHCRYVHLMLSFLIQLTRQQALVHDRDLCDLLKKLLCPDPVRRLSCREALKHSYFDVLREL